MSRVPPLLSKWISPSFGGWIACFVGVDVQKWDPVRDCLVEVWWPHAQRKATLPTLPLYHPASNGMVGAVVTGHVLHFSDEKIDDRGSKI